MSILVTNDDGVYSAGLRVLTGELSKLADVTIVAPSREQSAIGTAVTLRQTLRVQKIDPVVPAAETYAVDGTPSDSVILALGKLVKSKVDLVVSGINQGLNLGEDVLISGTVSAALQAYLRGFPAMAVSAAYENGQYLDAAARVAGILAAKIISDLPLSEIFLNVNLPDLPLSKIRGAIVTRLASESHVNTVEEGGDGQKYYRLVRQMVSKSTDSGTDVWAVGRGNISITPLYTRRFDKSSLPLLDKLCADLVQELQKYRETVH